MSTENRNLEELFNRLDGQWDTHEPQLGHQERFLDRLNGKKKSKGKGLLYKIAMPAAAAVLILIGITIGYTPESAGGDAIAANLSPRTAQTQQYFSSIIQKELAKVENENSPETKKLVQDALVHMQELEADYEKITHELAEKGENKQLIHAMITNLQTRISFLEDVLTKIENIKKIKESYHEDNNA